MVKSRFIAYSYAEALFAIIQDNADSFNDWLNIFPILTAAFVNVNFYITKQELYNMLYNSGISSELVCNFMYCLNGNFSILPSIHKCFIGLCSKTYSLKNVKVYSYCGTLSDIEHDFITRLVHSKYNVNNVSITIYLDKTLVSGFLILVDDDVIDCSVKERVQLLKNTLLK